MNCGRQPNGALLYAARQFVENSIDHELNIERRHRIPTTDFAFKINPLSNYARLINFRFCKDDISKASKAIGRPNNLKRTSRNGYGANPELKACVVLRLFAGPCRWIDLEEQFGKHSSHLSETFCKTLERFIERRGDLLNGNISPEFLAGNAISYAEAVQRNSNAITNCVGFIDGKVIEIARPGEYRMQNVVYNGHKQEKACIEISSNRHCRWAILHEFGPLEGRHHDWTLYARRHMKEQLPSVLMIDGKQCYIHGTGDYNRKIFFGGTVSRLVSLYGAKGLQ